MMGMIKVKLILLDERLKNITGLRDIDFELPENNATVGELLRMIAEKYGDEMLEIFLKPETFILLNGKNIEFLGGTNAKLSNGDRVAIIPLIVGGL
ncbi:MAG: MoaD/ThiS family protein [Candidatus Bathyarchaeia archaeon]